MNDISSYLSSKEATKPAKLAVIDKNIEDKCKR